jgi:hypothetical protein
VILACRLMGFTSRYIGMFPLYPRHGQRANRRPIFIGHYKNGEGH